MHGKHAVIAAVGLVIAALFAACGSSGSKAVAPLRTTPIIVGTTTTVDLPTTTTVVTSDAAAIDADRSDNALFFEIASQNPVNPADPRLAIELMGSALSYDRNTLTVLSVKREHDIGSFVVTQSSITQKTTAGLPAGDAEAVVVSSCAIDTVAVVADATGAVVTPASNSRDPINDRLDLVNGHWIMSESGLGKGTC
jgi:hypothetical protein